MIGFQLSMRFLAKICWWSFNPGQNNSICGARMNFQQLRCTKDATDSPSFIFLASLGLIIFRFGL
jgi:hypothetical protein